MDGGDEAFGTEFEELHHDDSSPNSELGNSWGQRGRARGRHPKQEHLLPDVPQVLQLAAHPAKAYQAGVWEGAPIPLPILPQKDKAKVQPHAPHCQSPQARAHATALVTTYVWFGMAAKADWPMPEPAFQSWPGRQSAPCPIIGFPIRTSNTLWAKWSKKTMWFCADESYIEFWGSGCMKSIEINLILPLKCQNHPSRPLKNNAPDYYLLFTQFYSSIHWMNE